MESILDGVYIIDTEGRLSFVNDVVTKRSGLPRDWFIGRHYLDIIKPEYKESALKSFYAHMRGETPPPYEVELVYERPSGDTLFIEVVTKPLCENGHIIGILGISRDITWRKHAEEELRRHRDHLEQLVYERTRALTESEKKYRDLVDNALVGVYKSRLNGDILYLNNNFLHMLGFRSVDEIVPLNSLSIYKSPDDRVALVKMIRETGSARSYEVQLLTKTGEPVDVLLSATLEGDVISGMALDITERKKAEDEVKAKTARLLDTNAALRVLLDQREDDKREIEKRYEANMRDLVMPYLEDLTNTGLTPRQQASVQAIQANLAIIASPLLKGLQHRYSTFTPTEIKVANLIRAGKSVKEIATRLGVSESAANLHRQHVRNKLGLKNVKRNLKTYLMSLED